MDHADTLVEAYLQINGYFTVAEYPVIESLGKRHYGVATDLDILAFRFPGAGTAGLAESRRDKPFVSIHEDCDGTLHHCRRP